MKNLFDFADEDVQNFISSDNCKNENIKDNASSSNSKEEVEKEAKNLYNKYKNYSQDELLNEFLSTSKSKLKDGSLTKEKINSTISSLSPFLNSSQKEYLKDLIGRLDD